MKIPKTKWKRNTSGFGYTSEFSLAPYEEQIIGMPQVTANKRGVNDIAWQASGDIKIYGTLSDKAAKTRLWQEISPYDEVNKTINAIKVVAEDKQAEVVLRVILN